MLLRHQCFRRILKVIETVNLIIALSAFFRTYLRFMKDVSINKCQSSLMKYYPSTSAVSEKLLIRNTSQQLLEKWREKWR